jgi:hypothetical protein
MSSLHELVSTIMISDTATHSVTATVLDIQRSSTRCCTNNTVHSAAYTAKTAYSTAVLYNQTATVQHKEPESQ